MVRLRGHYQIVLVQTPDLMRPLLHVMTARTHKVHLLLITA
jgi:hypothetical protein